MDSEHVQCGFGATNARVAASLHDGSLPPDNGGCHFAADTGHKAFCSGHALVPALMKPSSLPIFLRNCSATYSALIREGEWNGTSSTHVANTRAFILRSAAAGNLCAQVHDNLRAWPSQRGICHSCQREAQKRTQCWPTSSATRRYCIRRMLLHNPAPSLHTYP